MNKITKTRILSRNLTPCCPPTTIEFLVLQKNLDGAKSIRTQKPYSDISEGRYCKTPIEDKRNKKSQLKIINRKRVWIFACRRLENWELNSGYLQYPTCSIAPTPIIAWVETVIAGGKHDCCCDNCVSPNKSSFHGDQREKSNELTDGKIFPIFVCCRKGSVNSAS